MTLSETVGEGIISVAISGGSFHTLPGQLVGHSDYKNRSEGPQITCM